VDGGLAYGCIQSFPVASAVPGGASCPNEALRCDAMRGEGSRRRRRDRFPAGGVRNTTQAGSKRPQGRFGTRGGALAGQIHGAQDPQSPLERAGEEQRISRRTKALWTGKSFVASRRRGGIGLGDAPRIGHRVSAKHARPGIEGTSRQERQKQVAACVGKHNKLPQCEGGPRKRSRAS